jgi:hypothetical protein
MSAEHEQFKRLAMVLAVGEQSKRLAMVLAVGAFVSLNSGFYWLSGNYFDAHPEAGPDRVTYIRELFAIASGVLCVVTFLVGLNRRVLAHGLAALLGVFELCAGIWAFAAGEAPVVGTVLVIAGVLMPTLAWFSYHRRRAPWAFLLAMCGVFAIVDLFGAPRIGHALAINLWITLILPGLYAIAAVALTQLRGDYVERDIVAA